MEKISIKSLLLGVGIGISLTSLVNLSFYNGQVALNEQDTNRMIASPNESSRIEDKISEIKGKIGTSEMPQTEENTTSSDGQESQENPTAIREDVSIEIKNGMDSIAIAKMLKEENLIDNPQAFIELVEERRVARELKAGKKVIPVGSTVGEILDILLKLN